MLPAIPMIPANTAKIAINVDILVSVRIMHFREFEGNAPLSPEGVQGGR